MTTAPTVTTDAAALEAEALERLRQERAETDEEHREAGEEAGREWALAESYQNLRRLAAVADRVREGTVDQETIAAEVASVVDDMRDVESKIPEEADADEWLIGFVRGAREIFRKV